MSSDLKIIDFHEARLKKLGLQFSFIPSSKGYPAYRDPAAEAPGGHLSNDMGEGALRCLKNRYAPNELKR